MIALHVSVMSRLMCLVRIDSSVFFFFSVLFFFQAEDVVRDLVRSRGLGDVYKRQQQRGSGRLVLGADLGRDVRILVVDRVLADRRGDARGSRLRDARHDGPEVTVVEEVGAEAEVAVGLEVRAVSYTHLTLPSSDLG